MNLESFWIRFGTILAFLWASNKRYGVIKNRSGGLSFFGMLSLSHLSRLQDGPRGSKRRPRGPRKPPGAPQEAPRGLQERPRRLQEGLKRPQEPVKRAQNPPKNSQEPPKKPTRLFRSTWLGSRFRKIQKMQSMAPKGIEDA